MPSGRQIALALCAAVFAALAGAGFAEADRLKRDEPVQPFAVTTTEGEIGMEYHYFGETFKGRSGGRVRYDNHFFQEYYAGRATGYVYHPRFLSYSASIKAGLSQQRLRRTDDGGTDSVSDNSELLGYDLRLDFFKEHPVSGTLRSRRDERILMGLFVDRFLVRTESHSGTLRWNTRTLRMDLTGTHTEAEEFGLSSHSRSVTDTVEYNLHHNPSERIRTDLQYRLQNYDRRFRADTGNREIENENELATQDFRLTNRIDFDARRRSYLRSTFRVHDQQNNQDLTTWFWQEHLQLQHAPNLRSYLTTSLLRNDRPASTVDTYRAEAGVDHTLFRSLRSHLDIHGRRTDYDTFEEDRYGVTGRLNYRKTTPLGVLTAGVAQTFDRVERNGMSGSAEVFDESLALSSTTFTFLANEDVLPGTILVTDAANLTTFTENFDYEIQRQGRRTGIRIVPGGLLADGDSVLVDYRHEASADFAYLSDDRSMYIRHDFERLVPGLSLYAQRHDLRARSIQSDMDFRVLEYTDETFGLRQSWRDFLFTSEYQRYSDDSDGGFTQWRNQLEGNHTLAPRLRWGWNVGVSTTDYETGFESNDDHSRNVFAGTHLDGTFGRSGFWRLEARTMRETGRTDRTVNGIIARAGMNWRRMTVEGGARFEETDVFDSERDRMQVFVGIKRSLGRRTRQEVLR